MKKITTAIVLLMASSAHAATIVENDNLSWEPPPPGSEYFVEIFQDAEATDNTCVVFDYQTPSLGFDFATLQIPDRCIDEGSEWYVVDVGDVFSKGTIQAGAFPPLVTYGPTFFPPVVVGTGSNKPDIFLGVRTNLGFVESDVYGWVHLRQENDALTMIGNVVSYGSQGIIVGTTIVVPEPRSLTSSGLAIVGVLLRRKRSPERPPNKHK